MKTTNTTPTDTPNTQNLFLGIELSKSKWVLCFQDGSNLRERSIQAGDCAKLKEEIELCRQKFKLSASTTVHSCYEAGRDGFWLHRHLVEKGIQNRVFDSSSIEVDRRQKRRKTDRIDARKLAGLLVRMVLHGEKKVCSVVRVPSPAQEAAMRPDRERARMIGERTGHINRIRALLTLHGTAFKSWRRLKVEELTDWRGLPLPQELSREIERELKRLRCVDDQIKELEAEKKERLKAAEDSGALRAAKLQRLHGVGPQSSWTLSHEFFWREFRNRKEVGACAGLTGSPYDSGQSRRDQGISKAGSPRVRAVCVELGWCWLRFQPESELSLWFKKRFASGNARMRRVGIVALARKLLVALWKYLEKDEAPAGAILAAA